MKAGLQPVTTTAVPILSADIPLAVDTAPPIKWPGGKSKEYPFIQHLIPEFSRYIEPFFGGGAIYFKLHPKVAVINDFSTDLTDFYRYLKGEYDRAAFSRELYSYVDNWEKITASIKIFDDKFVKLYHEFRKDVLSIEDVKREVVRYMDEHTSQFNGLFDVAFCLNTKKLIDSITKNIISKISRIKKIEQVRGNISRGDLEKNIETAFRSGFYMHFRSIMNGKIGAPDRAKLTANYYFIREFCYGAMFRYNANGEFNIPYGGIAYNRKDFRKKVDLMLSESFQDLFSETTIENDDFEIVLNKYAAVETDFVFLDPPYDSDFSAYDNQAFGVKDHERLAQWSYNTKAKWMLLIKETDFINSLYANKPGITIESFEKQYLYNVKGRNDRDVRHLIIYNY